MARVSFSDPLPKNREKNLIPKLKLEDGETARIACLELPFSGYRHTLEKPVIRNGKALFKTVERKDKSTYETHAMEFVSAFLCLGDEGIMEENGVDVENCPACYASTRSDEVKPPKRRYAMNVVKYNLKPGTTELTSSYGVTVIPWEFSDTTFQKIRKFVLEGYDLKEKDLVLGPCTNKDFQKFEIMPSLTGAWLGSESSKKATLEAFKENKVSQEDLESLCGIKKERKWIELDLAEVHDRWVEINGVGSNPVSSKLNEVETSNISVPDATLATLTASSAEDSSTVTESDVTLNFDALLGMLDN